VLCRAQSLGAAIKLTDIRAITHYVWVHPGEERYAATGSTGGALIVARRCSNTARVSLRLSRRAANVMASKGYVTSERSNTRPDRSVLDGLGGRRPILDPAEGHGRDSRAVLGGIFGARAPRARAKCLQARISGDSDRRRGQPIWLGPYTSTRETRRLRGWRPQRCDRWRVEAVQ
jgi:hypothetical protein